MQYTYHTQGTCSTQIYFELENGKVHNVQFVNGCHGNLQAIGKLVEGMPVETVVERCGGISCGNKPTSCGDQLATALMLAMQEEEKKGEVMDGRQPARAEAISAEC